MVTENVDVVFRERGIRVIKRNLDELGVAANNATRAIFLLQRAFFVIGGAGIARGLQTQLDQLTAYENRLSLTSTSAANLEEVQDRLFLAANRSRSSFASLAEIYSRVALSVKNLGISQNEVLRVTETLAKASIIGGANAREANLALVQLGQGLASDRLSGDELRSVLEQLPFVAQLIADALGVTRGELRQLGKEGQLTAKAVLDALSGAADQVDELFANTAITIGQALDVAVNKFQEFLDTFDDNTGFSAAVAEGILLIANNLDLLATSGGIAALATIGFILDGYAKRIGTAVAGQIAYTRAVQNGNIVLLNSLRAEQQRTAFTLASAQADNAAAAASVNKTTAQVANTQAMVANARAQVANTEFVRTGNQARILATGRFASLTTAVNNHSLAVQRLNILESLQAAQQARLATAQTVLIASTNALTAAQTAQAAVAARAATLTGRLALAYPALAAAVGAAGRALSAFFAILAANPLTVAIVALSLLSVGLGRLRDATQQVSAVVDRNADVFRGVASAWREAEQTGRELAQVYDDLTQAELQLAQTEALQARRDAIEALADQIVGFNALASDLRTIVTLDTAFAEGASQVSQYFDQLVEGEISLTDFKDRVAELGSEVGQNSERFLNFSRRILDSVNSVERADGAVDELQAVIAVLNGTATASQTALARMALGLDDVTGSANAAASAVEFFISKIPALAQAQKIQAGIAEVAAQRTAGLADLDAQLASRQIDFQQYSARVAEIETLSRQATNEVSGLADARRSFSEDLQRNTLDAELAGLDGLSRTLRQNEIRYNELVTAAKAAGASQAELNQLAANKNALDEAARRNEAGRGGGGGGGGGEVASDLATELSLIESQIDTLNRYGLEAENVNKLTQIEEEIKRKLSDTEKELALGKLRNLEIAEEQVNVLRETLGPQRDFEIGQAALNNLLEQGLITLGQYNDGLRELRENVDAASNSLFGGFRQSISESILNVTEFGQAVGGIVVGSINAAADAIVEFARTGKLNLRQLFSDLFAQLLKLAAQQLLLRFVGQLLGIPGGGFFPGPVGGGGSIFGSSGGSIIAAAGGGSIRPIGPGSTDTRFLPLMTRPDERVDILTPQQQMQQRQMMRGDQSQQPAQRANVNVAVVLSEADVLSAFGSDAGDVVVVRAVERNKEPIRSVLGG